MKPMLALLTVVVLLLFSWYFLENIQDFDILLHMPGWTLLGVSIGFILSIITNGLFIRLILSSYSKKLSFVGSINASTISAIGNFFFPAGTGTLAQAKYLKSTHGFSYTDYLASLSGNYILVFLINGILGLLSLLFLWGHSGNSAYWVLVLVFLVMFLPNLYLARYGVPKGINLRLVSFRATKKVVRVIEEVLKGWNYIVSQPGLVLKLCGLVALNFIASMIIGYFSIEAVGADIGFWPLVLYGALGAVTLVLNITPGSIGIREGVFLFTMSIIGLSVVQVLAVAIVERAVRFVILLLGLSLFSKYFKSVTKKSNAEVKL